MIISSSQRSTVRTLSCTLVASPRPEPCCSIYPQNRTMLQHKRASTSRSYFCQSGYRHRNCCTRSYQWDKYIFRSDRIAHTCRSSRMTRSYHHLFEYRHNHFCIRSDLKGIHNFLQGRSYRSCIVLNRPRNLRHLSAGSYRHCYSWSFRTGRNLTTAEWLL